MHHRTRELGYVITLLRLGRNIVHPGQAVDQLTHALRTASLAEDDGAEDQLVVTALVHDIGKGLNEERHGEVVAEIMRDRLNGLYCELLRVHGLYVASVNHRWPWPDHSEGDEDLHAMALNFARWDHEALQPGPMRPFEHFLSRLEDIYEAKHLT
jgi:hypothetical protein